MSHHTHTHTHHHHYVIPHTYLHRYVAACFQCLGNGQCRTVGPAAVRDCHHCRCALLGTAGTGTGAGNTKQARVMTHSTQSVPGAQLTVSNTKQVSVITHSTQSFHGAQLTATQSRQVSLHRAFSPFMVHDWLGTTGNTKQAEVITHSTQSILQSTQSRPGSLHTALSPFCRQHKAGQGHYTQHSAHYASNTKLARVITHGTQSILQATQSRPGSLHTALSLFCRQHKAGQGHYTWHSVHSAGNTKQARVITHGTQSILQATQSRPGSLHMALSPFCRQHKAGQGHYIWHSVHSWCTNGL